jgi:hypothetical protein
MKPPEKNGCQVSRILQKRFSRYERNIMKTGILLGTAIVAALSSSAFAQATSTRTPEKAVSFKADIQPIFYDYCLNCHKPEGKGYAASGLDLRTYESLMKGTKYGAVIKPGDSFTSALVVGIEGRASPALRMPWGMNGTLSREHINLIKRWIEQGAKNN